MFNLDHAIAEWRRQMTIAGIKSPRVLDELESHLRDDVERQTKSGTDVQQAFERAVKQIGHATALEAEFKKIGGNKLAREQKWMRIYCTSFPIFYSLIGLYGLQRIEMSFVERTLGFVAVALSFLFIGRAQHYHKFLPVISDKQRRQRIQIASVLSWMICGGVFMNFVLPQLSLTEGQIVVAVLWLMMPVAAISGVVYGLGEAVHRQTATAAG